MPVFTASGLRVVDASRCYRMPVRVKLTAGDRSHEHAAIAVMHKGGLMRLEMLAPVIGEMETA